MDGFMETVKLVGAILGIATAAFIVFDRLFRARALPARSPDLSPSGTPPPGPTLARQRELDERSRGPGPGSALIQGRGLFSRIGRR
jgi:hypothetical protein